MRSFCVYYNPFLKFYGDWKTRLHSHERTTNLSKPRTNFSCLCSCLFLYFIYFLSLIYMCVANQPIFSNNANTQTSKFEGVTNHSQPICILPHSTELQILVLSLPCPSYPSIQGHQRTLPTPLFSPSHIY